MGDLDSNYPFFWFTAIFTKRAVTCAVHVVRELSVVGRCREPSPGSGRHKTAVQLRDAFLFTYPVVK